MSTGENFHRPIVGREVSGYVRQDLRGGALIRVEEPVNENDRALSRARLPVIPHQFVASKPLITVINPVEPDGLLAELYALGHQTSSSKIGGLPGPHVAHRRQYGSNPHLRAPQRRLQQKPFAQQAVLI
jgi:hypothetical protein